MQECRRGAAEGVRRGSKQRGGNAGSKQTRSIQSAGSGQGNGSQASGQGGWGASAQASECQPVPPGRGGGGARGRARGEPGAGPRPGGRGSKIRSSIFLVILAERSPQTRAATAWRRRASLWGGAGPSPRPRPCKHTATPAGRGAHAGSAPPRREVRAPATGSSHLAQRAREVRLVPVAHRLGRVVAPGRGRARSGRGVSVRR
jgi:hypothetical protein